MITWGTVMHFFFPPATKDRDEDRQHYDRQIHILRQRDIELRRRISEIEAQIEHRIKEAKNGAM